LSHRRAPGAARRALLGATVVLSVGLALTACDASGSPAPTGAISFAENPGATPNYIFPFVRCAYFTVSNLNQFQFLMYRPLYWFGRGSSTAVQYPLSLARAPQFREHDTVIKIHLRGWKFSDGKTVNAKSVMFFLNMYRADPASYCGYNAGYGIPDELAAATGLGDTVTLTFTHPVSPNWILYNYLSELTPMPEAWDKTSLTAKAGSGRCATGAYGAAATDAACRAVQRFLDTEAVQRGTYTGSLWQVVDGPWKLTRFNSMGDATFVPNGSYSGPQKAQVKHVYLDAFKTTNAEEQALYARKLTIGYVDPNTLPGPAPKLGKAGPNVPSLSGTYRLMTGIPWSFNYAPLNFSSSDPKGRELDQLYIRQALQSSINQVGIIRSVDKGYGVPTCSPIPQNVPAEISAPISCPYRYSVSTARSLLAAHGWRLDHGVQTCERPGVGTGRCGQGVTAGTTLDFSLIWRSGIPELNETLTAQVAAWRRIGIVVHHTQSIFNTVVSQCSGGSFQICMWGSGWVYAPDYYPSGETLFTAGGSFNPGKYLNAEMTALVTESVTKRVPLSAYGRFAAQQLPVLYEPNPTALVEVWTKLKGVQSPNPLHNFMPEYLHY
jgi:peptide/nickel transport system substrate-binding protein